MTFTHDQTLRLGGREEKSYNTYQPNNQHNPNLSLTHFPTITKQIPSALILRQFHAAGGLRIVGDPLLFRWENQGQLIKFAVGSNHV